MAWRFSPPPNAPFVTASLGQTAQGDTNSGHGVIMQALKNVAGGKYSGVVGSHIGYVYPHPFSNGGSSSAHYRGNVETYRDVGLAFGEAMAKLVKK